jgi:CheY-like chemotaxis protein
MAKVLVIDDEYGIAELLQAVLEDEEHTVVTAPNGRVGLELLETVAADIIFLDYMMPIMDGAAVLRWLNAEEPRRNVPVVMMSSIPEDSVAQRCSGYVHFLRKPFNVFNVLDIVRRLVPLDGFTTSPK